MGLCGFVVLIVFILGGFRDTKRERYKHTVGVCVIVLFLIFFQNLSVRFSELSDKFCAHIRLQRFRDTDAVGCLEVFE